MDRLEEVTLKELTEFFKAWMKDIMDEREKRYLDKFDSVDAHISRALAAKQEVREEKQWSVGTIVSTLVALVALAIAMLRR
jgi:hypothetical protein